MSDVLRYILIALGGLILCVIPIMLLLFTLSAATVMKFIGTMSQFIEQDIKGRNDR